MHKMSTKWTILLQKVYCMYLNQTINKKLNNVQKNTKNQKSDPAFNDKLLLNSLKNEEKNLLFRVDTHWNIKMLMIHSTSIYTI